MTVTVRLFAILRERAGRDSLEISLPQGATVAEAVEAIRREGSMADLIGRLPLRVAVNREYADPEARLAEGDELALVPPVSGGGEVHARVHDGPISVERITGLVGRPGAGAIVCFQGVTRDVSTLDYEAYTEMAEERIASILAECMAAYGLEAAAAEHRMGSVPLGEASVVIAVSAAHREEAFAGARKAIDRIKAEVPIWKREVEESGSRWVEGTLPP